MSAIHDTLVHADQAEAIGLTTSLTAEQAEALDRARTNLMDGDAASAHAVSIVLDHTVAVPVYRWDGVLADMTRLAAKATQRGFPIPQVIELRRTETHVIAQLLGGAPVFDGWRLVADIERIKVEGSDRRVTLVRSAYGEECPVEYRDAPERCEHCHMGRKRNRTFVIRHEDGRMMQIGSTCVADYLGSEALDAWLTLGPLRQLADEIEAMDFDADALGLYLRTGRDRSRAVPVVDFLAAVIAETRVYGYTSSASSLHPDVATGRSVWVTMQTAKHTPTTEDDWRMAQAVLDFAAALGDGEFAHNIRSIVSACRVRLVDANTIAALIPIFDAAQATRNEHVPGALEGGKVVGEWTLAKMFERLDVYNHVWRYTLVFHDTDRREIVWHTTAPFDKGGVRLEKGATYRVSATVKRLGAREGVAQTVISRASCYVSGTEPASVKASARKIAKGLSVDAPEWAQTPAQRKAKR